MIAIESKQAYLEIFYLFSAQEREGCPYQLGFGQSVGVFVVLQLQPLIGHKLKGTVRCSKQSRDKSLKGRIKKKKSNSFQ